MSEQEMQDDNEEFEVSNPPEDGKKRGPYKSQTKALEHKLEMALKRIDELEVLKNQHQQNQQVNAIDQEHEKAGLEFEEASTGSDPTVLRQKLDKLVEVKMKKAMVEAQTKQPTTSRTPSTIALRRWEESNDWINDPAYAEENRIANQINTKFENQWKAQYGDSELYGPDYMAELNAVLSRNDSVSRLLSKSGKEQPNKERTAVGTGRTQAGQRTLKGFDALLRNAEAAGMNIKDPEVVKRLRGYAEKTQPTNEEDE